MKSLFAAFVFLFSSLCLANTNDCPSDLMKAFAGNWYGVTQILDKDGVLQEKETSYSTFKINNCESYTSLVDSFNADGRLFRKERFNATWDADQNVFKIENVAMAGIVQQLKDEAFHSVYTTKDLGAKNFCDELFKLTNDPEPEIVRITKCFAVGEGGPLAYTRVMHETFDSLIWIQ